MVESEANLNQPAAGAEAAEGAVEAPKKKKYSSGLKGVQKMERNMTKAQRRMAKAVLRGLDTWSKERDRSAYKHKDGAVRDSMKNAAKAAGKFVRVASHVPADMMSALPVKPWKVMRSMRVFFPPAWFIR